MFRPRGLLTTDTAEEKDKFLADIKTLSDDIVGEGGAMAHVSDLVNVWGVWVASASSGLGHDAPLEGSPFGLYREGATLRAVMPGYPKRTRAACAHWRSAEDACDQAVLLGNDELYGGLGGEFTITTSSRANGLVVARHELGHSLIEVGEEYDGGPRTYFGDNSDAVANVGDLKWKSFLTEPDPVVQDAKVALQSYAWHNLNTTWVGSLKSSNDRKCPDAYDNSMLRLSLSSIAQPDHVNVTLNGKEIDLAPGFLPEMKDSLDRRWVEVFLREPLPAGNSTLSISLTPKGREAKEGKGGKMVTSVEIIEYGHSFVRKEGFVGAFPTVWDNSTVTLRPVSCPSRVSADWNRQTKSASCARSTTPASASCARTRCEGICSAALIRRTARASMSSICTANMHQPKITHPTAMLQMLTLLMVDITHTNGK